MSEWISVKDSCPDMAGQWVIAGCVGKLFCGQARYMPRKKIWVFPCAALAFEVTHWMPLPEPPKA